MATELSARPAAAGHCRGCGVPSAILLCALVFAVAAPTLAWTEFDNAIENLNVATALEMRRDGQWIVPELQGVPRLAKPPLTAWLTAAAIRPSTVADLNSEDGRLREAAYRRLTFEARWPSLAAFCLMLFATYVLGRVLGDADGLDGGWIGIVSAAACATTLMFMRYDRVASTDNLLALWVSAANAFLVVAVFRRRYWLGCCGAGFCLGLAMLTKGPVALIQSVVPIVIFLFLRRLRSRASDEQRTPVPSGRVWPAALVGLLLMLAVGGWWFLLMAARQGGMLSFWLAEITRVGADDLPPDKWYAHLTSLGQFQPWLIWLIVGAVLAIRDLRLRRCGGAVLACLLLFLPLLLMSLANDRFERYLLPLLPAGSVLIAWSIAHRGRDRTDTILTAVHWVTLAAIVVVVPWLATGRSNRSFLTTGEAPWFTWQTALMLSVPAAIVLLLAIRLDRRGWRWPLVFVTFGLMLIAHDIYTERRGQSPAGRADLRQIADRMHWDFRDCDIIMIRGNRRSVHRNPINIYANTLSIYSNRTARWVDSIESAQSSPGARWRVTVMARRKGDPDPPTPAGWNLIGRFQNGETKFVYLFDTAGKIAPR